MMRGILRGSFTRLLLRLMSCVSHDGGSGNLPSYPLLTHWVTFHFKFHRFFFPHQSLFCADCTEPLTSSNPNGCSDSLILYHFSLGLWCFPVVGLRPSIFSQETTEMTFSSLSLMLRSIGSCSVDASCHRGRQITVSVLMVGSARPL